MKLMTCLTRHPLPLAATALLTVLTTLAWAQQAPEKSQILKTENGDIRVVTVADGLFHPFSLAFLPNGDLLVNEHNGKLHMIHDDKMLPEPIWISPIPSDKTEALQFVAVHPDFAQNQLIYMSYGKQGPKGSTLAISRGRLSGSTVTDVEEIFVADAWETGGALAGRLFFGPDGMLYATVGDRDRICCNGSDDNSLRMKAQSLDNDYGKILRLRDDGTIPDDNPFVDTPGARPEIYSYGHRNGYGFAVNPETGELWEIEIGPMGGDEVNVLQKGHNYGWPLVSTGRNYTGTQVSDQPWFREGMDNPRVFWVPAISPSSMIFYTGNKFPDWKNNMFVGALTGRSLIRIAFHQPSQAEHRERLLVPLDVRIRDVAQSPDGYLYVATEQASGGTDLTGTVLRIEPTE